MSSEVTVGDPSVVTSRMWKVAIIIAQQSFLYGYVFACLNSCLVTGDANDASKCYYDTDDSHNACPPGTIYNQLNLSTLDAQLATSLVVVGAWISCMLGSYPSELYGRRKAIIFNNINFIVGAVLCSISSKTSLFIGRFILGLGVGLESVVVPVLLAEISTPETRGTVTLVHQVLLTLAIFVVSLVSYGFVTYVSHGWQYIQAGAVVPSIIQLIFQSYIPESPKWLVRHNCIAEAEKQMAPLRAVGHNMQAEIDALINENQESSSDSKDATWAEVFTYKKAMVIGCGLLLFQAMTGINSVIFYSTTIFGFAGFSQAILATTTVGIVNFILATISSYFIDITGRKKLLLIGTYTMLVALLMLSTVLVTADSTPTLQGVIAVVGVLLFVAGFSLGLGCVVWVMISEIMPTRLRTKAVSLFLSLNWGCNLVIGLVTLSAIDMLGNVNDKTMTDDEIQLHSKHGVGYLYYFFATVTFVTIIFIHVYVPETKGIRPEDLLTNKGASNVLVREPLLASLKDEF